MSPTDIAAPTTIQYLNFIMNFGALGLLAYITVVGLPSLLNDMKTEREAIRKIAVEEKKELIDMFLTQVENEHIRCKEEVDRLFKIHQKGGSQ